MTKILKYKRIIAILLAFVMALPVMQPYSVRAETETDTDSFITKIVDQYEESKEAQEDAKSVREKAGNDYLYGNYGNDVLDGRSGDVIVLKYFMDKEDFRNYVLEFSDGTQCTISDAGSLCYNYY